MISFNAQDEKEEKEQDEKDLALSAVGIRLKKSLTEEQIENAMDEINAIVTKHIKSARAKRFGIFKPALHLRLFNSIISNSKLPQLHNLFSKCHHLQPCTTWARFHNNSQKRTLMA